MMPYRGFAPPVLVEYPPKIIYVGQLGTYNIIYSTYSLVNQHDYGKSPFWVNQLQMAIFNSYINYIISLPEGIWMGHAQF